MFEALRNFLAGLLAKPEKEIAVQDLNPGDHIELHVHDPRTLGLVDPSGILTKRYDPEDLETLRLSGVVSHTFNVQGMSAFELSVTKVKPSLRTRTYTVMPHDIKKIRMLKRGKD